MHSMEFVTCMHTVRIEGLLHDHKSRYSFHPDISAAKNGWGHFSWGRGVRNLLCPSGFYLENWEILLFVLEFKIVKSGIFGLEKSCALNR